MVELQIIGVDCATQDAKTGLALATFASDSLSLCDVCLCSQARPAAEVISGWIADAGAEPSILALDAPLGWPVALRSLGTHSAGAGMSHSADHMFRRTTDRSVQERFGQRPLDVGADRIARTAHAALTLLDRVRNATGRPIPLLWDFAQPFAVGAIEVYPAATLRERGIRSKGYKKPGQLAERNEIIAALNHRMRLARISDLAAEADVLDAVICVLAAADYLKGHALGPPDLATAQIEGWIWVSDRGDV